MPTRRGVKDGDLVEVFNRASGHKDRVGDSGDATRADHTYHGWETFMFEAAQQGRGLRLAAQNRWEVRRPITPHLFYMPTYVSTSRITWTRDLC